MYRPTPHFIAAVVTLMLLGFAGFASAADVTVTGTNATQNTDGSAIPQDGSPNSLRDVRIQYGSCNSTNTGIATVTNTLTVAIAPTDVGFSRVVTGLNLTKYCFRARHSNLGNQYSDWTAVLVKDLTSPLRKPRPPGNISVASLQEDMIVSARWAADAFAPVAFNFGG